MGEGTMIIPQWGSLIAIQNAAKKYEDIVEVDAKKDDKGFTILKIVVKPQYNIDFVKDFLENHVPIGTGYDIIVDNTIVNKKNTNEDEPMKCNLECPYSEWIGTNPNGTKSIACNSRNWYMNSSDDCIERYTEKDIQKLINIYGSPNKERYKVFKQVDGDDDGNIFVTEEVIVDLDQAPTDGSNAVALTLTEICELLNNNELSLKKLDNLTNYLQKRHRDVPLDDCVEKLNAIMDGEIK